MSIVITPIAEADVASFRECLDAVAREKKYLALFEAPPLPRMHEFVKGNVANRVPQVVAKEGDRVVGWCDILPGWPHSLKHCGGLGMGLLSSHRGLGLGTQLLKACLALAQDAGITRVELEARADNVNAIRLYERLGFKHEGRKQNGMRIDGHYVDTLAMALLLDAEA